VIYYHNDEQKHIAQKSLKEVATPIYSNPVVTEIEAIDIFYPAEAYHQNYYNNNPSNGYCRFAIEPKVAKLRAKFAHKIKQEA